MGAQSNAGPVPRSPLESWLDEGLAAGGIVVASSERAARALTAAYHRARRAEGLTAWPAPRIRPWDGFVRAAWLARTSEARMILSPQQEESLWSEIIAADTSAAWLPGPLHRIALLAMDAHRLLCFYAPHFLRFGARTLWQQDAAVFSRWLATFDDACRSGGFLSASRLPLQLIPALTSDSIPRPPLLVAGFDRMLPIQRELFTAWGSWREARRAEMARQTSFYQAPDQSTELAACALWCADRLKANPHARLLVVTQQAATRRGEMERTFSRFLRSIGYSASGAPLFEFSLGVALRQVALARGALLVLRWLDAPIEEHELDWLISTGQLAAGNEESRALAAFMRALRRRGFERTQWPLRDFLAQSVFEPLPAAWIARFRQARLLFDKFARERASSRKQARPLEWAELASRLLEATGWPGGRALTSSEFQILRRWEQALDAFASLGFTGRQMSWSDFLSSLERMVAETLFAPESEDAPILIAGPAESAGLEAGGVWFLGASEDAWPVSGASHPFLPFDVQRDAGMPHASAQLDWQVAEAVTDRLLCSASEVRFSFARMADGVAMRPSRLILKAAGAPQELSQALVAPRARAAQTIWMEDASRIPFPAGPLRNGVNVLTAQSQCPFKAFAVARLDAKDWDRAQAGLTPKQRGNLLHAVLHSIWSPPPQGIRSHADLAARLDSLEEFVGFHVREALASENFAAARASLPPAYLALEETRLITLVGEWLRYEAQRIPFTVDKTEVETDASIAGLDLHLRLDRIDQLVDGSLLVIDYKTGNVTPQSWDLPRPDDVQLPLYAAFALQPAPTPPGLVFARVRAGQPCFAGRMADARATLFAFLGPQSHLVQKPLSQKNLEEWRRAIEDLARNFLEGRAEVNPREFPKTCERCGLQTLCRVHESHTQSDLEEGEAEEAEDA
jgi:ATP-dependent helicase/nuclease subunit B